MSSSPLWALLIQAWGFAWAAGVVGRVHGVVIAVLASLVFTRTPANTGQAPDGEAVAPRPAANPAPPARPAGRLREDRRFVTLAAAMSLGLFAQMGWSRTCTRCSFLPWVRARPGWQWARQPAAR
ncbi:hypothetical protein ACL7CI_01615 [Bordetella pertussis]|uniref:hypothetical protein n=1 Tax=Bordetella pertussis TaxID=520 RepID=UPI0039B38D44